MPYPYLTATEVRRLQARALHPTELQRHRWKQEAAMRRKLLTRVRDHAKARKHDPKWKAALYVIGYGGSILVVGRLLHRWPGNV